MCAWAESAGRCDSDLRLGLRGTDVHAQPPGGGEWGSGVSPGRRGMGLEIERFTGKVGDVRHFIFAV